MKHFALVGVLLLAASVLVTPFGATGHFGLLVASWAATAVGLTILVALDRPRRIGATLGLALLVGVPFAWLAREPFTLGRFGWIGVSEGASQDPSVLLVGLTLFAVPAAVACVGALARPALGGPLVLGGLLVATPGVVLLVSLAVEPNGATLVGPVVVGREAALKGMILAHGLVVASLAVPARARRGRRRLLGGWTTS